MHVDRFLETAVESGVIGADVLQSAFREFLGGARAPKSPGSDLIAFCEYLAFRKLLTPWQCRMLRHNRYKELSFGPYAFLAHLGTDERRDSYLVEHTTDNRRLILSFALHPPGVGGTILEFISLVEYERRSKRGQV